jgi:hypothetical protein
MPTTTVNQLTEAIRATASIKPRLTVTFAPRRLHCPPRLSQNARLGYSSFSSVRHLVRHGINTHTLYLARHCRRNMVDSLPRGMSTVVDESVEVCETRTRW